MNGSAVPEATRLDRLRLLVATSAAAMTGAMWLSQDVWRSVRGVLDIYAGPSIRPSLRPLTAKEQDRAKRGRASRGMADYSPLLINRLRPLLRGCAVQSSLLSGALHLPGPGGTLSWADQPLIPRSRHSFLQGQGRPGLSWRTDRHGLEAQTFDLGPSFGRIGEATS